MPDAILVEVESNDVVLRDSHRPVALLPMWIRCRIVWRQDQPTGTRQVPTAWSYNQ